MRLKKLPKMFLIVSMAFTLIGTSVGGTYVTAVYAAPVTEEQAEPELKETNTDREKIVLGGLLLAGLVAMAGKKSSGDKKGDSDGGKTSNSSNVTQGSMSAEETQLVNLINNERTKQGLATLKTNSQVANVARLHSKDMAVNNYFDHSNQKGESPFTRLRNAGIAYRAAGENIAINVSVPNAHTAFMNSAGHRANILGKDYTEVGVGIVHEGSRLYVTEDFIGK